MRIYMTALVLLCSFFLNVSSFADSTTTSPDIIIKETLTIEQLPDHHYKSLAEAYASRGESYLILNDDQSALEDFLMAQEYAQLVEEEQEMLSVRALLGAFLVHVRMENLQQVQSLFDPLCSLISSCSCKGKEEYRHVSNRFSHCSQRDQEQEDWPILGPERIPSKECQERVESTVNAIYDLIRKVKQETIKALATAMIERLSAEAMSCCRAGKLWKGCLQKLTNKYHYWQRYGVPSQTSYYREYDGMDL